MEENKKINKYKSFLPLFILIIVVIISIIYKNNIKERPVDLVSNEENTENTLNSVKTVSYSNDSKTINVTYINENNVSKVEYEINNENITLPIAMSASGARYSNSFNDIGVGDELWEHQEEVTISKDGNVLFKGKLINQ